MGIKYTGKIYKFSNGMEVVVSPITVGEYIDLATKYLSDVSEKNLNTKRAEVYIAQFTYLIKQVIGQDFLSDDFKRKFLYDYICNLYKVEDEKVLNQIEADTTVDIAPIKRECPHCGEMMEVYVQASLSFSGYNSYYPEEFYEIPKNILPSKGIPYPKNLQIYITPLTLSEQKLLESCDHANYYSKLLDGIYISGGTFDREQLLFADVQTLDVLRRIYVYDTNSRITAKSYTCRHCGEYSDISFKIDEIQYEDFPEEMFETFEYDDTEHYNEEQARNYSTRADELYENGEYKEAIEFYSKAIELNPNNAYYYYSRAFCYKDREEPNTFREPDDYESAIKDFRKAKELDPGYADCNKGIAECYFELAQMYTMNPDVSIDYYNKAIEVEPNIAYYYYRRSMCYRGLYNGNNKLNNAIGDLTKAIELEPDTAFYYHERANTYNHRMNNKQAAINDYKKAIELCKFPQDKWIKESCEKSLEKLEDKSEDEDDVNDTSFYEFEELLNSEDYEKGIELYTSKIEAAPDNPKYYFYRGHFYIQQNQYEDAIKDFSKIISITPNVSDVYKTRGLCYFQIANILMLSSDIKNLSDSIKGLRPIKTSHNKPSEFIENINNAIADYSKAIELEPDNFSYYRNRGDCYKLNEDYNLAIADYKEAIELCDEDSELDELKETLEELLQKIKKQESNIDTSALHHDPKKGRKLDL